MSADTTIQQIQQVMDREPLKKVSAAIERVRGVVVEGVTTGYDGMRWAPDVGDAVGLGVAGGFPLILGGYCMWTGGVVAASIAAAPIAMGVCALLPAWFCFGSLYMLWDASRIHRDPSRYIRQDFKKAARELSAAAAPLSNGLLKQSVQNFADIAARNFVLGHVATLQDRIVRGGESTAECEKMYKQGLRLIEQSAMKMHWNDSEALKAAFSSGRLPDASSFAAHLSGEHSKLQARIQSVIQNIQLRPA